MCDGFGCCLPTTCRCRKIQLVCSTQSSASATQNLQMALLETASDTSPQLLPLAQMQSSRHFGTLALPRLTSEVSPMLSKAGQVVAGCWCTKQEGVLQESVPTSSWLNPMHTNTGTQTPSGGIPLRHAGPPSACSPATPCHPG